MTAEEINKAIAEACGWKIVPSMCPDNVYLVNPSGVIERTIRKDGPLDEWFRLNIPKYFSDLNACNEMEKTLIGGHKSDYADHLFKLTGGTWDRTFHDIFNASHSTAAQRAEAFLKTLGKWKE